LQRVAFPSRDVAARRAAISNLAAWTLLCALRERRCPVGALPTRSDDSGRVLDLRGACFIELDPRPGAVIQWAVRGDQAVARIKQREPSTSVSLAELDATRRRALRSAFGTPVLVEPCPLGSDFDGGPPSSSRLPLLRSVDEAHRILSACMPQALAWIEQLVPAFVSLGHPRSPGANRSETHEAG